MLKKLNLEKSLFNLIEEDILAQSVGELKSTYKCEDLESTDDFIDTNNLINSALEQHKKNKLLNARKMLDQNSNDTSIVKTKIQDGKDFIIKLISSGRMPDGLTMAFHKGGDIPDDEVESIIQDLQDLGIDLKDE